VVGYSSSLQTMSDFDYYLMVSYLPMIRTTEDVTDSSKSNSNVDLMNSSHKATLLVRGDWPPLKMLCFRIKKEDREEVMKPKRECRALGLLEYHIPLGLTSRWRNSGQADSIHDQTHLRIPSQKKFLETINVVLRVCYIELYILLRSRIQEVV
jgi:hypothetical protein